LGGAEPGFWQPFGIRQVERILPGDPVVYIRSLNIHYIVVDEEELISTRQSLDDWLRDHAAEKVSQVEFTLQWGAPPQHLYLTRLE
jgi:adenylate kinase